MPATRDFKPNRQCKTPGPITQGMYNDRRMKGVEAFSGIHSHCRRILHRHSHHGNEV
jgi:hypothetical protein